MKRNFLISIWMTVATTVLLGVIYPLVATALAQRIFPRQANGEMISANGTAVGSSLIGQAVQFAGIFPSAAFGGRSRRIRSELFQRRRLESGAHECGVDHAGEGRRGTCRGGKSWGRNSRRHGDHLGIGPRSAHFAGVGGVSGSTRCEGAWNERAGRSRVGAKTHGRPSVGIFGRAPGQCVGIEFGTERRPSVALDAIAARTTTSNLCYKSSLRRRRRTYCPSQLARQDWRATPEPGRTPASPQFPRPSRRQICASRSCRGWR